MSEGFALHEIILDDDGKPYDYRFLEINPAFERITGLNKEAVLGKTVREVIPTIEPYWIEAYGRVALEGISTRIENYSVAFNSWYEVYAYCPAPRQFAVLFTNITERKRSEQAVEEARKELEHERNLLRSMIDNAKDFHLAYLDRDFNFVRVNKAYATACGYTPDELVGKNHFALYPHAENEAIFTNVRDSGIPVEYHDKAFVYPGRPERGITYWDWALVPVKGTSGEVEGLVLSLFETTGRKRTEQALRESESRLQKLFDDDLTGDFVCTSEGEIVLCNPAFASIFGFSSKEEAVGTSILELYVDPSERPTLLDALKRHGKIEGYEAWRKRRNGDPIHVVENLVGHFNSQGELFEYQGYIFDDTERKKTAQALRKSEERFRLLVTTSSEALYRMSPDWHEMRELHSQGFLANTERPNRNWLDEYIHPDDQPQVIASINKAIRGKSTFVFEHRVRRSDGTLGWTFSRAVPLLDENGEIVEWFGAASDITDRRIAEQALRESEARFRLAANAGKIGAYSRFLQSGNDYWSPEFLAIFGYGPDEPLPLKDGIPASVHPEDRPRVLAEAAARLDSAVNPEFRSEHRIILPNGEIRWVMIRGRIEFDTQGRPFRSHGIVMDITERKRSEKELEQLNETLEQRVAERSALAEARAKQLQSLAIELIETEERERRHFADLLHDDLQQMLASARFQLQAVGGDKPADPELENVSRILEESIAKSRRLTHELSPPVMYHGSLSSALEWLSDHMKDHFGLDVHLETENMPEFNNGPVKVFVFRAVQELLFNIVKHAGVRNAEVLLSGKNSHLYVTVSDQGKGFGIQELDHTKVQKGFGLISIRERARYIGGDLRIESEPGRGSRFHLTVAVQSATGESGHVPSGAPFNSVAQKTSSRGAGAGLRVLFVDDHKVMRQGLIRLISSQPDIEVAGEAANGREAVELARQLRPDVILMDISMPEMDGVEATRVIKAELPGVRVIGLSMFEDKSSAQNIISAGADAFIPKTASSAELLKAIYGSFD